MAERCPLLDIPEGVSPIEIPEFCWEHCEALWDKAVRDNGTVSEYDVYQNILFGDSECRHENIGYSHSALMAIGGKQREYVIVDLCNDCEEEVGEQGYIFDCPNT